MTLRDWTKLPDSNADLAFVRAGTSPVAGGGPQYLQAVIPSTASGVRSVGYRLDRLARASTPVEISAAVRLQAASVGARVGLAFWAGDDLDETDGYVLELLGDASATTLQLRRGPGLDGETLGSVAAGAYGAWQQMLLQFRYDRVGGQQVWVATSDVGAHDVDSPVWVKAFDQALIARHRAIRSARVGFLARSGTAGATAMIDQIVVTSTLSAVT